MTTSVSNSVEEYCVSILEPSHNQRSLHPKNFFKAVNFLKFLETISLSLPFQR